MSTLKISIFQNLPSGGGRNSYIEIKRHLGSKYKLQIFSDNISRNKASLINILIYSFVNYFYPNRKLIQKINSTDIFIGFHSWITKSPIFMRQIKIPIIYFCNETMREYYEDSHKKIQSPKEKIVNFIRLPLKYFNYTNTRSSNIIISTSKKTSLNISRAYGIESQVIYPGINIPKPKIQNQKNQILSVGSINQLKGFDVVIKAVGVLPPSRRLNLIIIGNGVNIEYRKYLMKLAKQLKVNLKIKINISKKRLEQYYLESKIFVYTPIDEPFGAVVLEAMSYGLPIVASNTGGYSEVLDNKTGILVKNRDPKLISQAIIQILDNKQLSNTITKHVKQVAQNYSYKHVFLQLDKIIKNYI